MVPSLNVEVRLFRDILLVTNAAINCTEYRLVIKTRRNRKADPPFTFGDSSPSENGSPRISALVHLFVN